MPALCHTLQDASQAMHKALAMLEYSFSVNMANMVFHLMHHIPEDMVCLGSVYGYWMYPFERFKHWLKSRALLNRRHPESTVIEAYILFDAAEFLNTSEATGASEGDNKLLRPAMDVASTMQGGKQVSCDHFLAKTCFLCKLFWWFEHPST